MSVRLSKTSGVDEVLGARSLEGVANPVLENIQANPACFVSLFHAASFYRLFMPLESSLETCSSFFDGSGLGISGIGSVRFEYFGFWVVRIGARRSI
ncbi:hypothetical protein F2Q69_00054787 [Brassica cretica]|uniref:Uncharacterized protein n=1 Tax=Brassica cretica TaxID=69181 RepID=A0A8S9MU82_BRACR|nr:hypothetical protein F2Q69_00054787 [Brassica cretica]